MTIKRNSAKCAYCDKELVSYDRHDFRTHSCVKAGKISQSYNHDLKQYVEDYPYFAVDGGLEYIRRVGSPKDYIETSIYDEPEPIS